MKRNYIGLQWKFFIRLFAICFLVMGVIAFQSYSSGADEVHRRVTQQLDEIGRVVEEAVSWEQIQSVIEQKSDLNLEYENITESLRNLHRIYASPENEFPIKHIWLLIPTASTPQVFYAAGGPSVKFLEDYSNFEEIYRVKNSGKVTHKAEYEENGALVQSVFAPVTSSETGKVVAVAKIDVLSSVIEQQMPSLWGRLFIFLILAGLISGAGSMILAKMVTRPIDRYVDFVNRVSEGNYHLRLEMQTQDELEKIGHALNVMLEKLEGLIETEADRDRLQKNITSLLRIVSAAADGDFTVSAEVTADTLGALADSFNLMVADLSTLIRDVKSSSDQIARSTREVLINTEAMSKGADTQAKEIESTYDAAKEMAEILKYANVRTSQAAESARRAAQVAMAGTEVVKKSIEWMHSIRERVQETARRVRTLSVSSVEVGEIIEVISDIANRTNLLAL
ncbi:MAG: HAMP domain-containing protein, partial [Calditrichaeota bacterium]|nr:HAMP domain-containing protein [Calditrichota bacterium]